MAVTQLGYFGYQVTDIEAWRRLATEIIGFEVVGGGDPLYLRLDERHHRVALHPGKTDRLEYVGWEAPSAEALEDIAGRVKTAGVEVARGSDADCGVRKVKRLIKFRDPNGFATEVYFGPERGTRPFVPSRPNAGFKTGVLGLGHVVLRCADPDASTRFYCEALGFRVTDTADLPRMSATFLHCNPRHHSLALTTSMPGAAGQVSHLMVEARTMEDVGCAYELCQSKGVPIWLSLGQHSNDRVLSFYIKSPSGFGLEYGFGGLEIDEATWQVEHWKVGSFWGHKPAA